MEEKRNYIKEYYSNKEHNLKALVENIDLTNEESIRVIKNEINKLQAQIDSKVVLLQDTIDKMTNKQYVSTEKKIVLHYRSNRQYNSYYYDLASGLETDYDEETCIKYNLDNKVGEFEVVVGYDFDLASIITKRYSYRISKDNDRIITKFLKENVISFMEDKVVSYNAITNGIDEYTDNLWRYIDKLNNVGGKEFVDTFYGVDYKGEYDLEDLREYNLKNKSFEIILKTAPSEIVDDLLKKELDLSIPIYKILGISQETYNSAIERGLIKTIYNNIDLIKGEDNKYHIEKTEKEWLDFIDELKGYEEDLEFYNIDYSIGWHYGYNRDRDDDLLGLILSYYTDNDNSVLRENYSLGKFTNYVVNETINQGYDSVRTFIGELTDYLKMCKSDNITPTLYSSYLKQTHDITSRNHKVIVEKEKETIFASRYKGFRTYSNNKGYFVVAPKNTDDLKKEGDNLNHCVASYIKRVIDDECLIYFLRKNKEESLITFEVRHNTIVQVRGMHNRKPSEKEVSALKEFAKCRGLEVSF